MARWVIGIFIISALTFLFPHLISANGGDQRVVDNAYFISLSRAPFTPRVGIKTSFLASFVDIRKNKLISEDLIVKIRIAKFSAVSKGEFLYEKDNVLIRGGILELPYTFAQSGFHEMFFDFAFASDPQKIYEVPDFLIDVQNQENPTPVANVWLVGIGAGTAGTLIGFLLAKQKRNTL